MNFKGVVIEESLENKSILNNIKILTTKVQQVTERHQTPWLTKWSLHTVEVPEADAEKVASLISKNLDYNHKSAWYADFNNGKIFYVIFKNKIFKWKKGEKNGPAEARTYGISLGIPKYQVDFPNA